MSNRFTANINGLTQASRNANDGISIAQTTEGALNEINDNLQNIRRLTTQAQNGTNSDSDRQSIQDEIDARLQEIDRISQQTEFNGVKVLSKDQSLSIQVGANDGQTIDIQLNRIDASTLGMDTFNATKMATKVGQGTVIDDSATPGTTAPMSDADMTEMQKTIEGDADVGANATLYVTSDGKYIAVGDAGAKEFKATVTAADDTQQPPVESKVEFTADAVVDSKGLADAGIGQLKTIDDALAQVDKLRSGLGAVQNRFDSVISNLDSTVNNLSASRSRIQDADFASEVSNMSRANILQQAGVTVLGQANQVPQNVLSLLR
ncbi:FliC/FljB family flagellin [Pluralibacter gergoviae]|nr:FliC/FljB family flagellin [Pluralibacter gergoviae]ELC3016913.1 FliC/FljB family flagellin [Pluralibacter gergoviae]ELC3021413.1 FliC/FljB family flagellin [Pluralibacter gergoviae]